MPFRRVDVGFLVARPPVPDNRPVVVAVEFFDDDTKALIRRVRLSTVVRVLAAVGVIVFVGCVLRAAKEDAVVDVVAGFVGLVPLVTPLFVFAPPVVVVLPVLSNS